MPIPKYLNIRKVVKRIETKRPLLLLAKIKEKVKRQARKNIKKKRGSISTELGLKKYTIETKTSQRKSVAISAGIKFFLFKIFFFRNSFFMAYNNSLWKPYY